MLDLGQMRSFAEVAERGTIAAAAIARDFTAPAVSQHIAKLEAALGAQLFDRAGGRLRLTDAGAALLPVALEMIDLESRGREIVKQPARRPHVVVAGFASAIATLLVPQLDQLDNMTVEIFEAEDADAMRDVRLGTVDLVLTQEYQGTPQPRDPRFTYAPVATDQLRLVLPAAMPTTTTVESLGASNWLVNGRGTRCADATRQLLRAANLDPPISGTVADNDTLLALVAAGHGVTIVPELLLTKTGPPVTVADQELGVERTILAVCRTVAADALDPLIDLLRSGTT